MMENKRLKTKTLKYEKASERDKTLIRVIGLVFIVIIFWRIIPESFTLLQKLVTIEEWSIDKNTILVVLVSLMGIIITVISNLTIFMVNKLFAATIFDGKEILQELRLVTPKIHLCNIKLKNLYLKYDSPSQSIFTVSFMEGDAESNKDNIYCMNTISLNDEISIPLTKILAKEGAANFYLLMDFNNDYKYVAHIQFSYNNNFEIVKNSFQLEHRYATKKAFDKWCRANSIPYDIELKQTIWTKIKQCITIINK